MKSLLLFADRDFDLDQDLPPQAEMLIQDLELETLFTAMARGDAYLHDVARHAMLLSLDEPQAICYRQRVLADCLAQSVLVHDLYTTAVEAIEAEHKVWGLWGRQSPNTVLHRAVNVLEIFVSFLRRIRTLADSAAGRFHSDGFVRFFAMLTRELDDDYLQTVEAHLKTLDFPHGVLISARLGEGQKGTSYVLHRPPAPHWRDRLALRGHTGYSFQIDERDESGFRALEALRGRGVNLVANALAQSTDHILSFFTMVRAELAFYIGCLNLHETLHAKNEPLCFPEPIAEQQPILTASALYDVCLALRIQERVVGNALRAEGKSLVMITGANQGGKSTFLRSIGVAYLMMQCGLFVPAQEFRASVSDGLYTHFRREEDASLTSGKFDEELHRMSTIVDLVTPNSILLCNESFAATNEREGSEIARQVIRALMEGGIRIFFVTHLFDLAHGLSQQSSSAALFLRAEREPGGRRPFHIREGAPLPTSYGQDSYASIFNTDATTGDTSTLAD